MNTPGAAKGPPHPRILVVPAPTILWHEEDKAIGGEGPYAQFYGPTILMGQIVG